MDVILRQDFPSLGKLGDKVKVKPGYARNYLIPKGIAIAATKANLNVLEQDRRAAAKRAEKKLEAAKSFGEFLAHVELNFKRSTADEERLYGSVTSADIYATLMDRPDVQRFIETFGVELDRRQINLDEPIKSLGDYTVDVKLHTDVTVAIKLHVEKDEG